MGARLLPRNLPELFSYSLALEREATWHFMGEGMHIGRAPRSTREALAMALAFERRTQAFYTDVAENARDDTVRAFAAEMSNDEQRHVSRLELLLERETDAAAIEAEDNEAGDELPVG